ncbi:MAG: nuclear transport factor 2 family protein [Acidimicrobiales bacterium]
MSSPRIEMVRQIYEAFARADLEAVLAVTDAEVEIRQSAEIPYGGVYHGHTGFTEFAVNLLGTVEATNNITEEIFEAGEQVVQRGRARGTVRANGAAYDVSEVHIWTVSEGGKVTRAEFFIDTPAFLAALNAHA